MRALRWLLAVAVLALLASGAMGHSFYPWECCSSTDCWPMGTDADAKEPEPQIVPGGYRLRDGRFIPQASTRPSPDGRFHVCRQAGALTGALITPADKPVCLWVPVPGS